MVLGLVRVRLGAHRPAYGRRRRSLLPPGNPYRLDLVLLVPNADRDHGTCLGGCEALGQLDGEAVH